MRTHRQYLFLFFLLVLVFITMMPTSIRTSARHVSQDQSLRGDDGKKIHEFRHGRDLLLAKGVPFEPNELLRPGWEKRLEPAFAQMPEMRETRKLGAILKGAQIAHTLH